MVAIALPFRYLYLVTGSSTPVQSGILAVSPNSVSFGDQQENTASRPPSTLNLSNTGNANLVVSNVTISGADAAMNLTIISQGSMTITPSNCSVR